MFITCEWVGGDCGHWEIYENGEFILSLSCDDSELSETLRSLRDTTPET